MEINEPTRVIFTVTKEDIGQWDIPLLMQIKEDGRLKAPRFQGYHDLTDKKLDKVQCENCKKMAAYLLDKKPRRNLYGNDMQDIIFPLIYCLAQRGFDNRLSNPKRFYNFCTKFINDSQDIQEKTFLKTKQRLLTELNHPLEEEIVILLAEADARVETCYRLKTAIENILSKS